MNPHLHPVAAWWGTTAPPAVANATRTVTGTAAGDRHYSHHIRDQLTTNVAEQVALGYAPSADDLHATRPEGRQIMRTRVASIHANLIRAVLAARGDDELTAAFAANQSWSGHYPAGDWTQISVDGRLAFEVEPHQSFADTVNVRWPGPDGDHVHHTVEAF